MSKAIRYIDRIKAGHAVLVLFFFLAGCIAPVTINVNYETAAWEPPFELYEGESVAIFHFVDSRSGMGSFEAGLIGGKVLYLTEEISSLATRAFEAELKGANIDVTLDPSAKEVRFVIIGELKEFVIAPVDRDGMVKIYITFAVRFVENESSEALWSGWYSSVTKGRASGTDEELAKALSVVIVEAFSTSARGVINKAAPELKRLSLETLPFDAPPAEAKPAMSGLSRVTVTTVPPLSAVYVDGEYMGLSPVSADLKPGSHIVRSVGAGRKVVEKEISVEADSYHTIELSFD